MEDTMAKTAVGLFEDSGLVNGVIRDLESNGILRKDIRVIGEPLEFAGEGVLSTPRTDFEVDLTHDLMALGVVQADANAYVEGVQRGGVIVFATGEKAEKAADIMNRQGAVGTERVSGARPALPNVDHDPSGQNAGTISGARMFVW
jgi:hypothetical protein